MRQNRNQVVLYQNYVLTMQPITDDDVDRIATCLRVLAERSDLMHEIFNTACRGSLSIMLAAKIQEDKAAQEVSHGGWSGEKNA